MDAVVLTSGLGGRAPPTKDVYVTPGCMRVDINQLCMDGECPALDPAKNGLDFFESLGKSYPCKVLTTSACCLCISS